MEKHAEQPFHLQRWMELEVEAETETSGLRVRLLLEWEGEGFREMGSSDCGAGAQEGGCCAAAEGG